MYKGFFPKGLREESQIRLPAAQKGRLIGCVKRT